LTDTQYVAKQKLTTKQGIPLVTFSCKSSQTSRLNSVLQIKTASYPEKLFFFFFEKKELSYKVVGGWQNIPHQLFPLVPSLALLT